MREFFVVIAHDGDLQKETTFEDFPDDEAIKEAIDGFQYGTIEKRYEIIPFA